MEEIKIFATEISGIGITKYKDPVTEKEVEVEYKLTTNINPGKDVDVPGVDVENILKDSLTREINNDLNKRKLLSIITFATNSNNSKSSLLISFLESSNIPPLIFFKYPN